MSTGGVDLEALTLRCSACGENLLDRRRGEWTIRNGILKIGEDGTVRALCPTPRCGQVLEVPFLRVSENAQPSETTAEAAPPAPRRRRIMVRRVLGA